MKVPGGLQPLIDDGVIDGVLGQLKSGKEASVYLVSCGGEVRCAKVYKEAGHRGFHKLASYREGRQARGSRDQRAMDKGRRSRHGRREQESAWKNAEVDALYRLVEAGVRVPRPYVAYEGVLVMELVADEQGHAAPRLNDVEPDAQQARDWHRQLMRQVVRMLCIGLIHGDLSEYNVLLGADGLVIIDLPQAVDASGNNAAFRMLERDVNNIRAYCGRFAQELLVTDYAHEIWRLYESGNLRHDSPLTGRFRHDEAPADLHAVIGQIDEARREFELRERGRERAAAELTEKE